MDGDAHLVENENILLSCRNDAVDIFKPFFSTAKIRLSRLAAQPTAAAILTTGNQIREPLQRNDFAVFFRLDKLRDIDLQSRPRCTDCKTDGRCGFTIAVSGVYLPVSFHISKPHTLLH